jgi:hypothetical protein
MEGAKNILYAYGFGIGCLLAFLVLILLGWRSSRKILRYTCYNVSAVFAALFLFEVYGFFKQQHPALRVSYSGTFFDNLAVSGWKKDVGYGPKEDTAFTVTAIRKNNDTLIYRVSYTFENGIRKTPFTNTESRRFAWFLGCSFTFGDGLHDTQTLPFYFDEYTNPRYQVVNLGFSGYGPHQALKLTEEKLLKTKNIADSSVAFFTFIPDHFLRAAGNMEWDTAGPWYEIENDSLVFKGSFNEKFYRSQNYLLKRLRAVWNNAYLYRTFFAPKVKPEDVDRTLAILKQMQMRLKERGIAFHVIISLMNTKVLETQQFYAGLRQRAIPCFFIDSIVPGARTLPAKYFITGDDHPNEVYNKRVAAFLANHVFKKE